MNRDCLILLPPPRCDERTLKAPQRLRLCQIDRELEFAFHRFSRLPIPISPLDSSHVCCTLTVNCAFPEIYVYLRPPLQSSIYEVQFHFALARIV